MDLDKFSRWLMSGGGQSEIGGQPRKYHPGAEGEEDDGGRKRRGNTLSVPTALIDQYTDISYLRPDRLLGYSSPEPWDTLRKSRGEFRTGDSDLSFQSGDSNSRSSIPEFTDASDPDFFVVDVSELPESPASAGILFEPLETIRDEPEGVSLICPSRIERVMMEVVYSRLLTARFRGEVASVLCDYRFRLDPEGLPIAIKIWDKCQKCMFYEVADVPPESPNIDQFNINFPLPDLLKGPSSKYDLYRYFINQSVISLLNRLFNDARKAVREDPTFNLRHLTSLQDEDDMKKQAVTECGEVAKKFGDALSSFVAEIRGELQFYPKYWKDFLPSNQHALIVVHASRTGLKYLLHEELLESPYWPDDDVPPYGSSVLEGIAAFECLVREVKVAARLDFSSKPRLLDDFSGSVTAALTKRFQSVEEILKRCMKSEVWTPVPNQLYSITVIDLFSFIHHVFDAVCELHAPIDWMEPCFLQFLGRLSRNFSDSVQKDCAEQTILAIRDAADNIFNKLHSPIARVEGVGGFISLSDTGKKSKKGGLMSLMGFKKKDKKKLGPYGNSPSVSDAATPILSPRSDIESPHQDHVHLHSGEDSESEARSETSERTTKTGKTSSKGKKKKKKSKRGGKDGDSPVNTLLANLPENFNEVADRIGNDMALRYFGLKKALENLPLKSWLVRLHNLLFFCEQLPSLALKFQELAERIVNKRDPNHRQIIAALMEAEGRGGKSLQEARSSLRQSFIPSSGLLEMSEDPTIVQRLQSILTEVIQSCCHLVTERGLHVCRYISLRIVYYDFGEDLFEELYNPSFDRYTLENILSAFRDTVERFINNSPDVFKNALRSYIVEDLAKAWMLYITEVGYHGFVFSPDDMNVLDEDLEALKEYASRQNISPEITLNEGTPDASVINMFDYINDFFCLISSKPQVLAQLGGNYKNPDAAKSAKAATSAGKVVEGSPGQDGAGPPPTDLFKPLFGDEDIAAMAGEVKKRKKGGGYMKMVGLGGFKGWGGKKHKDKPEN